MKKFIITVFATLLIFCCNSQIINVCGSDTIKFQLDNYTDGIINWQESYDTVAWTTIPNATGTLYSFYPTEEKYYRAMIKTSECEPLYSPISFVQLPPYANAGTDRVIGSTTTHLLANNPGNASGVWSLYFGSGTILEPNNPRSEFTGNYGDSILLVWNVTNTCGQNSDTVNIIFQELETNTNFIVVDMTDELLSDSAEMANGLYKIKFSDPEITPADSVILIGMREDISFLRVVTGFLFQDSIYYFNTEQGTFEDLFTTGVFNMGDAVNQSLMEENIQFLDEFPTRKTIQSLSGNKGIRLLYVSTDNDKRYPELINTEYYSPEKGFVIPLPSLVLFESDDSKLRLSIDNSFVSVDPNFVLDIQFKWFARIKSLTIGVDNAQFQYGYSTILVITDDITYEKEKSILELSKNMYFMAGPVPVMVTTKFEIVAAFNAGATGSMTFDRTVLNTRNFTALITGKPGDLHLYTTSSNTKEEDYSLELNGELTSELKIGPQISFLAYGIVGPYIDVPLKANASLCAATDLEKFNWQANAGLGIEGNLGARAQICGKTLFDFSFTIFDCPLGPQIVFPSEIELMSGFNQSGISGGYLADPIMIQVKSSLGFPVPFVQLKVELGLGNGSTSQTYYYSDLNGMVYIDWQLGSNPLNMMKITAGDCDFENLDGSPMYVYAFSSEPPYSCENSDLQMVMITEGDQMFPLVSGGEAPYQYSTDGMMYSSTVPVFDLNDPGEFSVFVKDAHDCTIMQSFNIYPTDICANSDLFVTANVEGTNVVIDAENGVSPYLFALDNPTVFSETDTYLNLEVGTHYAYVKDANTCIDSVLFEIEEQTIEPLIAVYPTNNQSYVAITNITFEWLAGFFAENQVYDIYLKPDGGSFSILVSDYPQLSYTYSTPLEYASLYEWRVVVKDQGGLPMDTADFNFTTESEIIIAPEVPELLYPTNNSELFTTNVEFQWVDQVGDFKYDFYLDCSVAGQICAMNLTDNELLVNNLFADSTYFWKVVIKSIETGETATSPVWSFSFDTLSTVTDIDGNVYQTVVIGQQKWMAENFKALNFNDGTPIDNVIDYGEWEATVTPAYSWYNNDYLTYGVIYGPLYNWYTVDTISNGNKNVCPLGWHVPDGDDWGALTDALGGGSVAGGKLKETGTLHWTDPNTGATNISGFTALPGGGKDSYPSSYFTPIYDTGNWWNTDQASSGSAWFFRLDYNSEGTSGGYCTKFMGLSVRCVKD
jgi:uncharacterized protein (TIGR02145 family)